MISEDIKNQKLWLPVPMSDIENIVNRKIFSGNSNCYQYSLRKNICYNLQYLEFISKHCFKEIDLTTVLQKQNYKMFIIVSASIIEGILYHEIRKNNLLKPHWKLLDIFKSNPKDLENKKVKIESHYFEEVIEPDDIEITFAQLLKKSEKEKLFGSDHGLYAKIKIIKQLRDKVHIHIARSSFDTDYNSYNIKELNLAKTTLLEILEKYFLLLDDEKNKYFSYLLL